jgi:hypothetical protein
MESTGRGRGRAHLFLARLKPSTPGHPGEDVDAEKQEERRSSAPSITGLTATAQPVPILPEAGRGRGLKEVFGRGRPSLGSIAITSNLREDAQPFTPSFPYEFNDDFYNPLQRTGTTEEATNLTRDVALMSLDAKERLEPHKKSPGTGGIAVQMEANYIKVNLSPEHGVYEYSVKFEPQIEDPKIKYTLLDQISSQIGKVRHFDGEGILCFPTKLLFDESEYTTHHPASAEPVVVTLKFNLKKTSQMSLRWYNLLFRQIQKDLGMTRIGRNYYIHQERVLVPDFRLEVWPGYVATVSEFEDGLLLCLDVSHRVLRMETCLAVMNSVNRDATLRTNVAGLLLKQVVMTRYNNCTHVIDDIAWDETPSDSFVLRDGTSITFIDYYKQHHDIDIQDLSQPLILCRQKQRTVQAVSLFFFLQIHSFYCILTYSTSDFCRYREISS